MLEAFSIVILKTICRCLNKIVCCKLTLHISCIIVSEKFQSRQGKLRRMAFYNIIWMDLEMTGLDIEKDHILEIACIITDKTLRIISEELNIVIHQPDIILRNMNEWCMEHHKISGLVDDCRSSTISLKEAELKVLKFLEKYVPKGKCPLAGNTIYMDRLFLYKYMPLVHEYLHFRIIDVSSVKELYRRWDPSIHAAAPTKKLKHRALDDIKESIDELAHYKKHMK
ncbi:PREDICTED: probable oligoribonuclease isoform X2 [Dinoponera quadriceps]|uniref:Probable oligoribonuclease n=1 Tax=Dinoponera quadriceps TaxID=609295 RepID=A0A6P3WTF8_DINQU|nr:PREDICTED: probable oligoribonuclease isoform X2 [Dinoponera quadriceps]